MHTTSETPILYFGTPVVLLTTTNPDETANVAPISSVFWLGWRCVIGISALSKTTENIRRTGECAVNLPSVSQAGAVNRLALLTGSNPVPAGKAQKGYRYQPDKFGVSGLNQLESATVRPPRVAECPVQMEAIVTSEHGMAQDDDQQSGRLTTFELRIQRVYLDESIHLNGNPNRVDPDKWRPLIMSFQKFYGLGQQVQESTLASIPEALYKSPDMERARMI